MELSRNESGVGAMELLLIVVIIGILGFTGWFVWHGRQTANKTFDTTSNSSVPITKKMTKPVQAVKSVTGNINKAFGVGFSFSYPETWKLTDSIDGPVPLNPSVGGTVETLTLTSPSGVYVVSYRVGANGGLGGMCVPSPEAKLLSLDTAAVAGYPAVVFAESSANKQRSVPPVAGEENQVVYQMELRNKSRVDTAKVGGSDCQLYLSEVVKLRAENDVTLLNAEIRANGLTEDSSAATFKQVRSTEEYQTAKAILTSTTLQ